MVSESNLSIEERLALRKGTKNIFIDGADKYSESGLIKKVLGNRVKAKSDLEKIKVDYARNQVHSSSIEPRNESTTNLSVEEGPINLDSVVAQIPEFIMGTPSPRVESIDDIQSPNQEFFKSSKVESSALSRSFEYQRGDDILSDLLNYYKSNILNGESSTAVLMEDSNTILATIAASSRLSLVIEGNSRSGKSLILDKLSNLLPNYYDVESCSDKALFANADEVNKYDFIYIKELQSVLQNNNGIKEAIKLITENKNASHKANGLTYVLSKDLTIISTGADENIKTQKRDVELTGRLIILRTDSSEEKTKSICKYQDNLLEGNIEDVVFSEKSFYKLKSHIIKVLDYDKGFLNPFASAYASHLPETQKSVYSRTLYNSLIHAAAKFNFPNRVEKGNKIIANLDDIMLIHGLYHDNYCEALKSLSRNSFYSIEKSLNEHDRLEKEDYMKREIELIETIKGGIVDWGSILESGINSMKTYHPTVFDNWIKLQDGN